MTIYTVQPGPLGSNSWKLLVDGVEVETLDDEAQAIEAACRAAHLAWTLHAVAYRVLVVSITGQVRVETWQDAGY